MIEYLQLPLAADREADAIAPTLYSCRYKNAILGARNAVYARTRAKLAKQKW
jgi:hypothetical protein